MVRRAAARRIRAMTAFIGDSDMTPAAQLQWLKLADDFERQADEANLPRAAGPDGVRPGEHWGA